MPCVMRNDLEIEPFGIFEGDVEYNTRNVAHCVGFYLFPGLIGCD